jgi:hypothetical protein
MRGRHVFAVACLVARDVPKSYELIPTAQAKAKQDELAQKEYSAGVIAYYWSVNKRLNKLLHHNVFLSGT